MDIYDAANNEYYEVKSSLQADTTSTANQMYKYDTSHIKDWRFEGYDIPDSPQKGNLEISGSFQYKHWDITYRSYRSGMIVYYVTLNTKRYEQKVVTVAAVVTSASIGFAIGMSEQFARQRVTQTCVN